jgi:hypothetical protein
VKARGPAGPVGRGGRPLAGGPHDGPPDRPPDGRSTSRTASL